MQKIIIDEEFKDLLPVLDKDTYAMLEENLIRNGCTDSLILWSDTLIDGHNRYEICNRHGIPFNTVNKDFRSREEALIWIICTQVARRNLTPMQLCHFRGLHYMTDKKMHGGNRRYPAESSSGQSDHLNDDLQGSTANRLAEQYRVSSKTIRRDARVAAAIETIGEASRPAKKMILSGAAGIDKNKLSGLSEKPKEEIKAVAAAIENGTYEQLKPARSSSAYPKRPIEILLTEAGTVLLAITKLSDSFIVLPKIGLGKDKENLKAAIKTCIRHLEDLYGQIT